MPSYYENVPHWIKEVPEHLKAQAMCEEVVCIEPRSLAFVPSHFKTEAYALKQLEETHMHLTACLIT